MGRLYQQPAERWHGRLEGIQAGLVHGWCVDAADPERRVVVELLVDGECVGTAIADVARPDLLAAWTKLGVADPCHGFVADFGPMQFAQTRTLTARVANSGDALEGVVVSREDAAPPVAAAYVFGDGGLRLHGWAPRAQGGSAPALVRALEGLQELAEARASDYHPALRGQGAEQEGFILDLPPSLADGHPHTVRVVDARGAALPGSPVTVCCRLEGARALLTREQPVLRAVIEEYERHLPRSLGFAHYAAWREVFEQDGPSRKPRGVLALVIFGEGTPGELARTRKSLRVQVGCRSQVHEVPTATPWVAFLQAVLASGCTAVAFVRAGDVLAASAAAHMLAALEEPGAQVVYADTEFEGRPWLKPAWAPDYAFATDHALEFMLVRASFATHCLQAPAAAHGPAAFMWQALARASVQGPRAILHVPRVLHTRCTHQGEQEAASRLAAAQAALKLIEPASALVELAPQPGRALFHPRRIVRKLSRAERRLGVSLIIPTRDRVDLLERCLASVRRHTQWAGPLEIIVIDNDSVEPRTHAFFRAARREGIKILPYRGRFNFAAMNNRAVEMASGDVVGLINNDIEAMHDGWLEELMAQLMRPGVGVVGPKLLWPNGIVQHAGVVLGVGHAAGHFGNRLADTDWGDHGRNRLVQQVSAVTAACLFTRRDDYLALGGMDGEAFPVTFNDVEYCLKARDVGLQVTWTPFATLLHAESASRGPEETPAQRARAARELDLLRQRWGSALMRDPAYHPSLNLDAHSHAFGGLAIPPRDRAPRTGELPS